MKLSAFLKARPVHPYFIGLLTCLNLSSPMVLAGQVALPTNPLDIQETIETITKVGNDDAQTKDKSEADEPCDELCDLNTEVKRLELEKRKQDLAYEQSLQTLIQELQQLKLQSELKEAQNAKQLEELTRQQQHLSLENEVKEAKNKQQIANLRAEYDRLSLQNQIQSEKNAKEEMDINLQVSRFSFESSKLKLEQMRLSDRIEQIEKEQEWQNLVDKPRRYLSNPMEGDHLVISDRRIDLNQPIWPGTADYIIERIDFFNNKNEDYPIFLVIDYCEGGSVIEGARILKAMQNSRAPVYVVVKSLAASMAAIITALAERSFAYPDALILHHQVWGISFGNKTEQQEQLQLLDEWTQRVLTPVAVKMGISLETLIKRMYEKNSVGDWLEFADKAQALGWVTDIVSDIRDESQIHRPSEQQHEYGSLMAKLNQTDAQGKLFAKLPRLRPFDVYHLYNPDHYYRY